VGFACGILRRNITSHLSGRGLAADLKTRSYPGRDWGSWFECVAEGRSQIEIVGNTDFVDNNNIRFTSIYPSAEISD